MSYKEKLIELLKTIPEVKEQMESLEFGCKYIMKNCHPEIFWETSEQIFIHHIMWEWLVEIIWLPLQERFIRMFCEKNNIRFSIHTNYYWLDDVLNFSAVYIEWNEYCQIDNTKDFDNQSEDIYQKIYEVLYNLKRKLVIGVLIEN